MWNFNNTNILIFYDKFLTSQITNPQIAHNYDRVRRKEKKMAGVETNKRQLGSWKVSIHRPREMEMDRYYSITIPFLYQLQLRAVIAVTSYFGLDFMGDSRQLCTSRNKLVRIPFCTWYNFNIMGRKWISR